MSQSISICLATLYTWGITLADMYQPIYLQRLLLSRELTPTYLSTNNLLSLPVVFSGLQAGYIIFLCLIIVPCKYLCHYFYHAGVQMLTFLYIILRRLSTQLLPLRDWPPFFFEGLVTFFPQADHALHIFISHPRWPGAVLWVETPINWEIMKYEREMWREVGWQRTQNVKWLSESRAHQKARKESD